MDAHDRESGLVDPAVFIDKDGTLVEDVPFNVDPSRVRLASGAGEALRLLADHGYRLIIVTNQSGVARGLFTEGDVEAMGRHLATRLASDGARIDGFYFCPHLPNATVERYRRACDCRKPGAGLIVRAASDLGIDIARSWMLGDIATDVAAGQAAGCRTGLVNAQPERELVQLRRPPDLVAADLSTAARVLVSLPAGKAGAGVQPS
jgi:D,D-heptose 1,7-bisphosphate phosphatase